MGVVIESQDGKSKLEIGEFTSPQGRNFVSVRRLYKSGQDGKFYPHKTKSGGYNMIFLEPKEWKELLPRLIQFFGTGDDYTPPEPPVDEF